MVKKYLEVLETRPIGQEADYIRVEITDMTSAEVTAVQNNLKDIMSGKTYKSTLHNCNHDAVVPTPCLSTPVIL